MSDENQADDVVETQPDILPEIPASPEVESQKAEDKTIKVVELEAEDKQAIPENEPEVTRSSTVINLDDLESPSSPKKSAVTSLNSIGQVLKGRMWLAGVIIAILVVVFLFLPPVSLASRLFAGGRYTTLNAENPALHHNDGLTFILLDTDNGNAKVKLETIPEAHFTADMVGKDWLPAVQNLPANLTPKSPFYMIYVRGKNAVPARLEVDIPNAAEPWETLDLYAWDNEQWNWIPSRLDRDAYLLIADTTDAPDTVMVMQNQVGTTQIAVEVEEIPSIGIDSSVGEVDVSGLLIGTMGGTTGDATKLPLASEGGQASVVPVIRNWIPGRDANPGLVQDMLSFEIDRENHIQELLGIAQSGGYPGLILDYRNLDSTLSASYAAFISNLATSFHESNLWLGVVVDTPTQNADGTWDTKGYDWLTLGSSVDQIRISMPSSASAYTPGGAAEVLVSYAVTQVNRHKVRLLFSTLSVDETGPVSAGSIYGSLGKITMISASEDSYEPGTNLRFSLNTPVLANLDAVTGATSLTISDKTYWLGTPQWLYTRMGLTTRYGLGGVVLRDFYDEGNLPGLVLAVADFLAQMETIPYQLPDINWQIEGPGGQTSTATTKLGQPELDWTTPDVTGTYKIMASVSGMDNGSVNVTVSAPVAVISETVAAGDSEGQAGGAGIEIADSEDEDGNGEETTTDETLKAAFVADVTVPDNTHFEKGEQFTKTWRMRNSGTTDWPEGTVLRFSSGTQLSSVEEVEVGSVAPGADVDISVDMTAPDEDGSFKSTWQLSSEGVDITNGSIYTIIQVGEQPAAPQPAAPIAAPGATGSFELGGHVRDLGMPYASTMHYAGMNWTKTQIHFGQDAYSIVNAAHANGFKIQLSAIGGAGMVTEAGYEQKFASWVASLAAAGADAIEVWNEPNIDREWQIGLISPQSYTNLLCASYNAIKVANPGTAVISAAPSPTGWFGGCGPNGCDDQPWMEGLWNAGAANCMDYIGAHHNAGATSPSARSGHPADDGAHHHSWYFLPQTELYYNIFRGTRQIFYTEMGYASQEGVPTFSDQFGWARGTNNSQQASWLAEAVQLSINTGMVRCIIVWNLDFVRYGTDPQDGFAIIRPGGGCPACESLHSILGTR